MTQVRQRRGESCWNRTSRVNVSSSALPGLSEGDTFWGIDSNNTFLLQDGRVWRQSSSFSQSAMTM